MEKQIILLIFTVLFTGITGTLGKGNNCNNYYFTGNIYGDSFVALGVALILVITILIILIIYHYFGKKYKKITRKKQKRKSKINYNSES